MDNKLTDEFLDRQQEQEQEQEQEQDVKVGEPCPSVGCGGILGATAFDATGVRDIICPECGKCWEDVRDFDT